MSIYIEGMNMPTDGNETIIRIQPDGTVLDQYGHYLAITAVPIQKHGKLKDADAVERNLLKMQQAQTGPCSHGVRKSRAVLRDAPTIIPSNLSKEE